MTRKEQKSFASWDQSPRAMWQRIMGWLEQDFADVANTLASMLYRFADWLRTPPPSSPARPSPG